MSDELFGERRQALENSFFAQRDRELMEKLKKQVQRDALSDACGIKDPAVLERLVNANISAETITALTLVPLIAVAWADGKIAPEEREAIRSATESIGIEADSTCRQMLDAWLVEAPGPELVAAWKGYIEALSESASSEAIETLRDDVLGHARQIAAAAGGVLGVGSISKREKAVIDDLASAFSS
ncbi:MAG: hypothetical protein WD070_01445 [Pirellulaceae bacterium]